MARNFVSGFELAEDKKEVTTTNIPSYQSGIITFTVPFDNGQKIPSPERVVFNGKTTVVRFTDGTKEVVRCGDLDQYDRDAAVAWAIVHKLFGSKSQFKKFVQKNSVTTMTVEEEQIRQAAKTRKKLEKEETSF